MRADVLPNPLHDRWLHMLENAKPAHVLTHLLEFAPSCGRCDAEVVSAEDGCELAGLGTDDGYSPRLVQLQSQLAEATTRAQSRVLHHYIDEETWFILWVDKL